MEGKIKHMFFRSICKTYRAYCVEINLHSKQVDKVTLLLMKYIEEYHN